MTRGLVLFLALVVPASAAYAGAANFTLVNGTKAQLANLSVKRVGTDEWKPLGAAPDAGARGPITFKDQDCAFDIRAEVKDKGPVTWTNVNLCDVKSVTLNQDPSAGAWVDYDH